VADDKSLLHNNLQQGMRDMTHQEKPFKLGDCTFYSRLFVGTGKYQTFEIMQEALQASGCEVVTVAVRRERLLDQQNRNILDFLDQKRYKLLPNTAGCFSAEDAVRCARLGRELLEIDWVKLEVIADKKTLLPDPLGTLEATQTLVKEGFTVLVYTNDDPVTARKLADAGAASVMPAAAPIGSGQGVLNPNNIRIILEEARVPIIVGRRRHRQRRHHRHGTGRRWRTAQHRHCRRPKPRPDGPSHESRHYSRPKSIPRRKNTKKNLRHRLLTPRRRNRNLNPHPPRTNPRCFLVPFDRD